MVGKKVALGARNDNISLYRSLITRELEFLAVSGIRFFRAIPPLTSVYLSHTRISREKQDTVKPAIIPAGREYHKDENKGRRAARHSELNRVIFHDGKENRKFA